MKALENRTVDAKREMDILDALQDIRARNARNERVGHTVDLVANIRVEDLETEEDQRRREEEEEDEKLVREVFAKVTTPTPLVGQSSSSSSSSQPEASTSQPVTVKRKAGVIEPDLYALLPDSTRELINSKTATVAPVAKKPKPDLKSKLGIKVAKKGKVAV